MNYSPAKCRPKLKLEERVLVGLEYSREYCPYFPIGRRSARAQSSRSWGVRESTVCRIVQGVEDRLMGCGQFQLPGKQQLVGGFGKPQTGVMDVTETPIEQARFGGEASPPKA